MEQVFSQHWYKVSALKPSLREHTQLYRHKHKHRLWYVLLDKSTGRCYRFNSAAYYILGRMNGKRVIKDIWNDALDKLKDEAPTQDEMISMLGKLHGNDLLKCDVPPDSLDLFRRSKQQQKQKWKKRLTNPFSICIPLFDPNRLLDSVMLLVRPLFSIWGGIFWLSVVLTAFVLAAMNWGALTENVSDRVFSGQNILLLWLTYPFVKVMHEFGHAFTVKVWGGEVHETGILFLMFMPVPYVDASSASAFPNKRRRLLVGAEGMMVEMFIASFALFFWLNVESGLLSAIAYNIILIGGISTLFFNANPLLRFDGYYMLADALEMPNLASRSKRYLGYLLQHYIFGVTEARSPASSNDERIWLFGYAVASFFYRMFIVAAIIFLVAEKFFVVGVILAIWGCISMFALPFIRLLITLFTSPLLRKQRAKAILISSAFSVAVICFTFFTPVPLWTSAQGVIWLPEQAQLRAGTNGFVSKVLVQSGVNVEKNQALIKFEDPFLKYELDQLLEQRNEIRIRLNALWNNRVKAEIIKHGLKVLDLKIAQFYERRDKLVIYSKESGRFVMPNYQDMPGRYIRQGELLGYVVNHETTVVRAVVLQEDVGLIREYIDNIVVQLVDHPGETIQAKIKSVTPAGSEQLPSMALGSAGGGDILVVQGDKAGVTAIKKVFQFELSLPDNPAVEYMGSRVYVRFGHGAEPLAEQWYRSLRQLFLRRFNV